MLPSCEPVTGSVPPTVIDVVLPALNEADALPWVLGRMPEGMRAVVVDNGSTDGTADVARAHGAVVVHESVPGFGSACWAGLCAATAEVVCFMDADGSLDPRDLAGIVAPVLADSADLVLGARRPAPGAMTLHQRVANRVLAAELRRRTHVPLHDLGPMRAARRERLLALGLADRRSGWPLEMVLKAARAGWRISEIDVPYAPRRAGASKVTGTVRGTLRAIGDMSRLLAAE